MFEFPFGASGRLLCFPRYQLAFAEGRVDVQIIIQPDKKVPYQDVITVYDYCVKAKFKQVAFAPAS